MKATGIIRRIDNLGRLVIPRELFSTFGLDVGTPMEVFVDGGFILFRKYEPCCIFCGDSQDGDVFMGKQVCGNCCKDVVKFVTDNFVKD